ncbi:MAG: transketolase family protein [Parcubacteria group bacterium]
MINSNAKLAIGVFGKETPEFIPIRDGYGKGVVEAGQKDERIVVLCADLTESTRSHWFKEQFPERFIEMGVAEQNLATVGAGLAGYGKIPFIASYATFSPGRNWEQIRTTACLNDLPVKVVGAHAGVSVGPDGATHQALEDIALMRVLPGMTVVIPCDAIETHKATLALAHDDKHPGYLRLAREKSPVITTQDTPFEIGKAEIFREGDDVTLIACGPLVYNALVAAEELSKENINATVINNHTIKPLDEQTIIDSAKKTGAVVTIEEHQIAGGLGSAIAELLSQHQPTPQEFIGMKDTFGESGTPEELYKHFGLDSESIKEAVKKVLSRKQNL